MVLKIIFFDLHEVASVSIIVIEIQFTAAIVTLIILLGKNETAAGESNIV